MQQSTLLVPGTMLMVQPALAMVVGFNEALFLQRLHYWLQRNEHIYDEKSWIYNTYEDWEQQFPFFSTRTIRRIVKSLREQNLIQTTTNYNQRFSEKMLWYTINYDALSDLKIGSDDWSNCQKQRPSSQKQSPVCQKQRPSGQKQSPNCQKQRPSCQKQRPNQSKVADRLSKAASIEADCGDNMAGCLDNLANCRDNLADSSIYKRVTTKRNNKATTTEGDVAVVVVALSTHGLSRPIALGFAAQYPEEYLCEKIVFLELEKKRCPDLANPAGWLRRAIEEDFGPPPGYQTPAQQAAADRDQAKSLADQQREYDAIREQKQAKSAAQLAQQLAILQPRYGTTESLLTAWAEGRAYAATVIPTGSLKRFLDQSVLLSFADGHAQIGVWDQVALDQLALRGKQNLNEALAYAMRDTLDGRSGTYELVLLGADGAEEQKLCES